jgi:hypothetical protein
LTGSGWAIDWFGNNRSPWLTFVRESLAAARITPRGVIPETQLANELKRYPFVIVPVAELTGQETNRDVARL